MKLWLVYRTDAIVFYDEYDSAVVATNTKTEARKCCEQDFSGSWSSKNIKIKYLGEAKSGLQKGIICASYNAG